MLKFFLHLNCLCSFFIVYLIPFVKVRLKLFTGDILLEWLFEDLEKIDKTKPRENLPCAIYSMSQSWNPFKLQHVLSYHSPVYVRRHYRIIYRTARQRDTVHLCSVLPLLNRITRIKKTLQFLPDLSYI